MDVNRDLKKLRESKDLVECEKKGSILTVLFKIITGIYLLLKVSFIGEYFFAILYYIARAIINSFSLNKGVMKSPFANHLSMSLSFKEIQKIRENNSLAERHAIMIRLVDVFTKFKDIEIYKGKTFKTATNKGIYTLINNKRKNPNFDHMEIIPKSFYLCIQPMEKLMLLSNLMLIRSIFAGKEGRQKLFDFIYRKEIIMDIEIKIV